jgi:hypothetical protein
VAELDRVNNLYTPQNRFDVLSLSLFRPPIDLWNQVDLAD